MKKPKIFIGIIESGDVALRLSQGLRELGYEVTCVVNDQSKLKYQGYDRYIRNKNKLFYLNDIIKEFIKNFSSHDVYIFTFSSSFFSAFLYQRCARRLAYIDVPILKVMGKKIIFISLGSDLRSYPLLITELVRDGLNSHAKYIEKELVNLPLAKEQDLILRYKARIIEKYGDHIFAKPDRAQYLTRNYHLYWPPFDLNVINFKMNQSEEPLILHAPTNRAIKGTKYILNAIKRLEGEGYKFQFQLCENMDKDILRIKLEESEIIIDQLLLPGYGLFSIEGMASGNIVLGSAVPGYNGFPNDLPILTSTPDNIYNNLKRVLDDPALRMMFAKKGRIYVEKHHDYKLVTLEFINKIGIQ